ncbi:VanZ family protein [Pontibacillus salicampi]|uniref:VanZ family protein n=1 Tax=Pontibacillus salicampi TaxID=1449801 RepID=A0ABV6LSM4_9BACI
MSVKKLAYWLLPVAWMGMLFYSSSTPYQEQTLKPFLASYMDLSFLKPLLHPIVFTYHHTIVSVEQLGVEGFVEFFIRKGAHLGSFFILFGLFYIALHKGTASEKKRLWSLLLTISYAVIDEMHQGFTPNRTPYYGDVIIDTAGALLALLLVTTFRNKKQK